VDPDYRQLFNGVREILNRHDLEGLIELGCPENEYDLEVERILPQLATAKDATELAAIVQNEYTECFNHRASDAAVAAAADEIWALYVHVASLHSPEDISLMLAQEGGLGDVWRLLQPRFLLGGVLVHAVEIGELFRILRGAGADELAYRLLHALIEAKAALKQRRPLLSGGEASDIDLMKQVEAGEFEVVNQLECAFNDQATQIALTIDERAIVLNALDDPPDDLSALRVVLLNEHQWRVREGLD
jgi:hypothetical protein